MVRPVLHFVNIAIMFACAVACGSPAAPAPAANAPAADTSPPSTARPVATASEPATATPPSSTACTADTECGLIDPHGCGVAKGTGRAASTGDACTCFEGRCVMRPASPRVSAQPCGAGNDCGLESATARCEPGLHSDFEPSDRFVGPVCACNWSDHRCHLSWLEPVTCQSVDDCWVDETPNLHPIRRPPRMRGRVFRPCRDGENAPACVNGRCTVRGFTC
jgi:hypothetical protein